MSAWDRLFKFLMRALKILAMAVAVLLGSLALLFAFVQTPPGKRLLASVVSGNSLHVAGISGFVPTDLHAASVELLNSQGVWLRVEDATLRWSFTALFEGWLRIEVLSAARVDVRREPEKSGSGGFSLPVGVDLQSLSIAALHVAPALAGTEARWSVQGSGSLTADLHEGKLKLSADRTDGREGKLSADVRFDLAAGTVDGSVTLEEGRGGLLADLLERPDLEHVSAKLTAKGNASEGQGELSVAAGDAARMNGAAHWQPAGGATAFSLDLHAEGTEIAKWGGPVALAAEGTANRSAVVLHSASLSSAPLSLTASGRYDRNGDRLDLKASARSPAPGVLAAHFEGVDWHDLQLDAQVVLDHPTTQPAGPATFSGSAAQLVVAALPDRLPPLGRIAFKGALTLKPDGTVTVGALDVTSELAAVRASAGSFDRKTGAASAKAAIDVPSLAPFSALAQRELTGRAHVDLDVKKDSHGLQVGWQGTLHDIGAPGVPPGLVASEIKLSGKGRRGGDGGWSLSEVKVASDVGSLSVAGEGQGGTGRIDLSLDLQQLSTFRAGLTGSLRASSTINLEGGGGVAGSVSAQGTAENQPLSLAGRFERDQAGGIVVPSFEFHWASAALDVTALAITPDRTTGSAKLKVDRLQDIGKLLGLPLAGSLEAEVSTDPKLAQGRLQVHARGSDLQSGKMGARTAELDATIDDPLGTASVDAKLTASGLHGVDDLGRVTATVKGDRQDGFEVAAQAFGAQTNLSVAGKVTLPGDEIHLALSRFSGHLRGLPVSLAAPTKVTIAGQRVRIDPTTLQAGGARLSVKGELNPSPSDNLQLELGPMPLSLVDKFVPGIALEGTLHARATVRGPLGNPRVDVTYDASGVRLRQPQAVLLPSLALRGTASLVNKQVAVDARVSAGKAGNLEIKGKLATSPIAGTVTATGTLDVAPFAPLLGNQIRNVAGTVRSNVTLDIAGSKVTGGGTLDLANASLSLPETGMRLTSGSGRLVLQGDEIEVQRLAFQTAGRGTLSASGKLRLVPQEGVVVDLAVTSGRALLVSRPDLIATVSSDLRIAGSTAAAIDVSGVVTVDRADIKIGAGESARYPTIQVHEINKASAPPGAVLGAPKRVTPARAGGGAPVRLALTVNASAVFVRGRGVNADMAGTVRVSGDPSAPAVSGGLTMRRGDLTLLGRRLVFSRGVVTLDNLDHIDPRLDFVASSTVNSTTVQVAIKGTARDPVIEVTSSPPVPQDEALALLLFGKPSTSLSAFELAQLAEGVGELTGVVGGGGFMDRLRRTLGLDTFRVGSGSAQPNGTSAPVSLEAGRYVAPGVYVGARQGAAGNSSRGVVEIQVLEHTKVEGDIGADSNGRVGVKMEWDY